MDGLVLDDGVGTGEIDVLENAKGPTDRRLVSGSYTVHAISVQSHNLARLHLAHVVSIDGAQGARLRRHDVAGRVAVCRNTTNAQRAQS